MEHTFEIVKYNVLDDGSLYHIHITSPEYNKYNNDNDCNTLLLYQYNAQIYYELFSVNDKYYHKIFDDFYDIKPIRINNITHHAFDIYINDIIINRPIRLYSNGSNSNNSISTYVTDYILNNQHLLDVREPYILK